MGKGVGEAVAGIGVGSDVEVGTGEGTGEGVADWQAVMRMRHPIRIISFFMVVIKTQLPRTLFPSSNHNVCLVDNKLIQLPIRPM